MGYRLTQVVKRGVYLLGLAGKGQGQEFVGRDGTSNERGTSCSLNESPERNCGFRS